MISSSETIVKDIILYDSKKKYVKSIRPLMRELQIYENVFQMVMNGAISVIDADNIYEADKLYEKELMAQITIAYAGNDKLTRLDFYIDSITNYKRNGDNTVSYVFNLMSIESYSNKLSRISKGYCGDKKSIVGDIMKGLTNKRYICEDIKGECRILCPYLHPFDCIDLLLLYGGETSDCLFWENFSGFNLRRVTTMLQQKPQHHIYNSDNTLVNEKQDVYNSERETDSNLITNYSVDSLVNSRMQYLDDGIGNGIVQVYNPVTGLPDKYQYGDDSVNITYIHNDTCLNYKSYIQRHDILNQLKDNSINITIRGDINRSTGDTVLVEMLNNAYEKQYNNRLSGVFIITSILHDFLSAGYTQTLTLSK